MIWYMLDMRGFFGVEQSFPVSLGLNNKGGMDDAEFFEYVQKSIMGLYPDAALEKGKWACIKCINSISDGDGNDGLVLAVENQDILNVGGAFSLDFKEEAGAV
jgi:hypothetical protein